MIFSVVSPMVDDERQLPSPSATGWSIDLEAASGPVFIVLRLNPDDARKALAEHLVGIGSTKNALESERLVWAAPVRHVAVIW